MLRGPLGRPPKASGVRPPQGPHSEYAPSEVSSVLSKRATPVKRDYSRLLKATARLKISPGTKGEKQISLKIVRITEAAKCLRQTKKKTEETGTLSEAYSKQVDQAIEESKSLEHFGTLRLDVLAQKERQDRLNVSQRPKLAYEIFEGKASHWTFF